MTGHDSRPKVKTAVGHGRKHAAALLRYLIPALLLAPHEAARASDDTLLQARPGPGAGEVLLSWIGSPSLYEVFRSTSPSVVVSPGNKLSETSGSEWVDAPPGSYRIVFYAVMPACDPDCPAGRQCCGGACVDLGSDPLHCGGCAIVCNSGEACAAGVCSCPAPGMTCDGACVDPTSDSDHCDGCGIACGAGQVCSGGACVCAPGMTPCGGTCVDTRSDPQDCGGCGIACRSDQVCADSVCACPPGTTLCDGACVNTARDTDHCGGCGIVCPPERSVCAPDARGRGTCQCAPHRTGTACDTCIPNHTGPDCHACAAGYRMRNASGGIGDEIEVGPELDDEPDTEIDWSGYSCQPEETCAGVTCSGNGTCRLVDGEQACACRKGYVGSDCSACAPGYERDRSGQCVLGALCAAHLCSGRGACVDTESDLSCVCDPGVGGAQCEVCAPGYFDDGAGCAANQPCGSSSCSGHGRCDDSGGNALCACDPGYFGSACDETCVGRSCGGHGTCADVGGTAACVCDREGFDPASDCLACKPGFDPVVVGGTLVVCDQQVACGDEACSGHGACVTQVDASGGLLPHLCRCDMGYRGATCFDCAPGFRKSGSACAPLPPPPQIRVEGADQAIPAGSGRAVLRATSVGIGTFDRNLVWEIASGPGQIVPLKDGKVLVIAGEDPGGTDPQLVMLRVHPACCPGQSWDVPLTITAKNSLPITGAANPLLLPVEKAMRDFMEYRCVGAGILAIARHGQIIYARGFGRMDGRGWNDLPAGCASAHANPDLEDPVLPGAFATPPNAPMRIGSVTKGVTAAIAREAIVKKLISLGQVVELPDGSLDTVPPGGDVNSLVEGKRMVDPAVQALPGDLLKYLDVTHPQHVPPPVPATLPALDGDDSCDECYDPGTSSCVQSVQPDSPPECICAIGYTGNRCEYRFVSADCPVGNTDTDAKWKDVTFGQLLSHTSGLARSAPSFTSFVVPNFQLLRDTGSATDRDFWENEESHLYPPKDAAFLDARRADVAAALGGLDPGQEIFFVPSANTRTDVTDGQDFFVAAAGACLAEVPGAESRYSNTGFGFLSAVGSHLWPGGNGQFTGRVGQPATHVGSAVDLFLDEFVNIHGATDLADGILRLDDTADGQSFSPVPRHWSSGSATYYPGKNDLKRPYCVFTQDAGDPDNGSFDTAPWLDSEPDDVFNWPWQAESVTFGYSGPGGSAGAGGLAVKGTAFLEFMKRYFVGGDGLLSPSGGPIIGERRNGVWTIMNAHNGAFDGCYAFGMEVAGTRQTSNGQIVACTFASDCAAGGVCRQGQCVVPTTFYVPPVDAVTQRITDDFANIAGAQAILPDGVDVLVAVNQRADVKCTPNETYKCSTAYGTLDGFILHGLGQVDWSAVDQSFLNLGVLKPFEP